MYFLGNIYVTIFAWIILVCAGTWFGYFLREAVREGQPRVIKDKDLFWYLVVSFIIGFPCLIAVITGVLQWIN